MKRMESLPENGKVGTAPGKIILAGEHAVVYGRPAVAVPVWDAVATAVISVQSSASFTMHAHDIQQVINISDGGKADKSGNSEDNPLALAARLALTELDLAYALPSWRIDIHSTIPIASGLGSGAAVSAALIRAIFLQAGQTIDDATLSALIYESEKLHHGTPSGIDNTVVAYGKPVWYIKGNQPIPFQSKASLSILIGDSGVAAPTKESVGDVRLAWQRDPAHYEHLFDQIGEIVAKVRQAIQVGNVEQLGGLFNQNQLLLEELQVSHPKLEQLIRTAREAGALGAKLSGGGRGGNMIALVEPTAEERVKEALLKAGAKRVISTCI
ncbi:MAG: mevalonate kinase [Chloroflexota bacterium]